MQDQPVACFQVRFWSGDVQMILSRPGAAFAESRRLLCLHPSVRFVLCCEACVPANILALVWILRQSCGFMVRASASSQAKLSLP